MASSNDVTTPISDRSFSVYSIASKPPPQVRASSDETETKTKTSNACVVGLLCLLNFICTFDGTVLSTAITAVAQDIPGSTLEAFWTNTSMSLSSTVSQPLWIRLSEEFDKMSSTLCALALFTMGSSMALLADSFGLLIAARTTQGLGIGGLMALTNMIVLDLVTSRESGALLGWINSVRALGSACGPIVGAALSQHAAWRWIFWTNIPFAMIAFVSVPSLLRLDTARTPSSAGEIARRIDWFGMLLFVTSLTGFLIPLTWGGVLFDWVSPHTLAPLALCAFGLVGFIVYSKRFPKYPIIRTSLFSSATGVVTYSGSIVHGVAVFSLLYYLPVYYGIAKGATVLESALYVLPNTVLAALASAASGILITKTGRYRLILWVGWAAVAAGSGVLMVLDEGTTRVVAVLLPLVSGGGVGILFATLGMAAQASVSATDASAASSMSNFFRSLGQTLGIAVGGVVVQNVFRREVEKDETYRAYAAVWARNIARIGQALGTLTSPEEQALKAVVVSAVVQGTRAVWLLLCVLSATQLVASIVLVKNIDLDAPEAAKPRRLSISRPQLQMPIDPIAEDSFVRTPNQI